MKTCLHGHPQTPENVRYTAGRKVCIPCARIRGNAYTARHREERRRKSAQDYRDNADYYREYQRKISARRVEINRTYREKYPERYKATNAVNNAIQAGKLEREPCEVCGEKAQAHHDDYSRPLDVRWLCAQHHHQEHGRALELS